MIPIPNSAPSPMNISDIAMDQPHNHESLQTKDFLRHPKRRKLITIENLDDQCSSDSDSEIVEFDIPKIESWLQSNTEQKKQLLMSRQLKNLSIKKVDSTTTLFLYNSIFY